MEQTLTQKYEFLWRRLQETPPGWVVLLPVGFALLTVLLMWLFRRDRGFKGVIVPLVLVVAFSGLYLILAPMLLPFAGWLVVLAPALGVALLYVGLMYVNDARSIHPAWATFLGLLRCAVYAILATVFLLPGCQNYELQKYHSKVVFVHDVSASTLTVDDRPEVGQDPSKLPTRQDKVLQFLTATQDKNKQPQEAFLKRVVDKSPLSMYRFGSQLDEKFTLAFKQGDGDGKEELLRPWLRPDKSKIEVAANLSEADKQKERAKLEDLIDSLLMGTNIGGSLLQTVKLESGNVIQAIVVVSDGQSNLGSDEAFREFHARVTGGRHKIPVITVGVGDYRQPASIRIDDMQAPEIARPDDKFPIRIPVIGAGLTDEEFTLTLEAQRVKDGLGQPVADEKFALPARKGKFLGAGDFPQDVVEYEIDLQELRGVKEKDDTDGRLEGTWQFTAKVPRHPREAFAKAEHVSEPPTQVIVQKKKLRILLFAGGPNHDYQFLRTLLHREAVENRLELSVLLQTGRQDHVEQDVEKERLLMSFPDRLAEDPTAKYMSLSEYDVIIAIDPDWRELEPPQAKLLKEWVSNHSGGIIFVAGPVHTFHVARPAGLDHLTEIQKLFPVVLSDSRLPTLTLNHDPSRPYPLHFTGSAKLFDFLKLDEEGESPIAGWNDFFWGKDAVPPDAAADVKPVRGIHNFYPVERIKPDSTVIATFGGPPATRINNGLDEQPWLVSMRNGSGKTMFVGSAETRRLRGYNNLFYERFWIKMARFVSSGTTPQKRYGRILVARNTTAGPISVEAQLKGKDLLPLSQDLKPTLYVRKVADEAKPESTDLKAKPTQAEWTGWFSGSVTIRDPGEYEFKIPVPGTGEALVARSTVRRPNPELDNVRNNFALLHRLASEAKDVLAKLPAETRKELQKILQAPPTGEAGESKDGEARLFFTLANADYVEKCLVNVQPKVEEVKGRLDDLWDQGYRPNLTVHSLFLALAGPVLLGLLGFAILMFLKQITAALAFLGGFASISVLVLIATLIFRLEWPTLPVHFSSVLFVVVALLSVEWLTRKLLKLA